MDERDYKAMNKHENGNEVLAVVSSNVFVIQHKYTLLIYGCFKTKKKAEKYINGNQDFAIIRLAVE